MFRIVTISFNGSGYESNLSYESTQYVSQPAAISRGARYTTLSYESTSQLLLAGVPGTQPCPMSQPASRS